MTPRQQRFVGEYLVDLNGTQAAIRAGYSPKTANPAASRLLANVTIREAIETAQAKRAARTEITQDRVLDELSLLAFSNLEHYSVSDTGDVALTEGAPVGAMRALQSIKRRITTRNRGEDSEVIREVEIRLWDKPGPLKLAGQHVGILVDKMEHKVSEMRPLVIDRVSTRAELLAALGQKDTDAGGDSDDE